MKILLGDIFESKARTLVNTVNCVGVMGKGIALEFKRRYPQMFQEYTALCENHCVKPGCPYLYRDLEGNSVLNFPTKDNWRSPSKLSYIVDGLAWFRENYEKLEIDSIVFPPLGCGNGGLDWDSVGPIMYKALSDLPIEIEMYAPYGTPEEKLSEDYLRAHDRESTQEVVGKRSERLNARWLLLLEVVREVNAGRYTLHVGRVIFQKICYVLTRTGVQTGFVFHKGTYGPYSAEVAQAISALANANLIAERQTPGQTMVETVVSPRFQFDASLYTQQELEGMRRTVDLFCRMRNTDQAEMSATVLFSYDALWERQATVSEREILEYVLDWKKRWRETREDEIRQTIRSLAMLEWISPTQSYPLEDEY